MRGACLIRRPRPSMPWKNGGGETTEIAVSPPGAGLDDFDWRVAWRGSKPTGRSPPFPESTAP